MIVVNEDSAESMVRRRLKNLCAECDSGDVMCIAGIMVIKTGEGDDTIRLITFADGDANVSLTAKALTLVAHHIAEAAGTTLQEAIDA